MSEKAADAHAELRLCGISLLLPCLGQVDVFLPAGEDVSVYENQGGIPLQRTPSCVSPPQLRSLQPPYFPTALKGCTQE